MTTTTPAPVAPHLAPTFKQVAFIRRLAGERGFDPDHYAAMVRSKADASKAIDWLMRQPKRANPAVAAVEVGFYRHEGAVYKVVPARADENRRYAKRLDERTGSWEYAPGAIRLLAGVAPLTLDEAKEYGKAMGRCVACGALLTDERSVSEGVGPVCARKFA